jgi:hypothetical protein
VAYIGFVENELDNPKLSNNPKGFKILNPLCLPGLFWVLFYCLATVLLFFLAT